ncbi:MAG: MgtC/SapB family protein [Armatimonadetes bacterium]|nr:MgtC/SapB family protein [Armatimonadota bacterium]
MNSGKGNRSVGTEWLCLKRLVLACILGGIVGLERETLHRPAGLRTHILVCLGSALFTIVSIYGFFSYVRNDPARVAAQIVSGIGFLGAGTIMRHGANIKGLTTAASLWAVAGIGMAVGCGYLAGAVIATLLMFLTLTTMRRLELSKLNSSQTRGVVLQMINRPGQITEIHRVLEERKVDVKDLEMEIDKGRLVLRLMVALPAGLNLEELTQILADQGVEKLEWD